MANADYVFLNTYQFCSRVRRFTSTARSNGIWNHGVSRNTMQGRYTVSKEHSLFIVFFLNILVFC